MFAIPWHDRTLVGTTDTRRKNLRMSRWPLEEESPSFSIPRLSISVQPPFPEKRSQHFRWNRPLVRGAAPATTPRRSHRDSHNPSRFLRAFTIVGGSDDLRQWPKTALDRRHSRRLEDSPRATHSDLRFMVPSAPRAVGSVRVTGQTPTNSCVIAGESHTRRELHPDLPTSELRLFGELAMKCLGRSMMPCPVARARYFECAKQRWGCAESSAAAGEELGHG